MDQEGIPVKVATLPGGVQEIFLPADNPTLKEALRIALGNDRAHGEVRVDNAPVDPTQAGSTRLAPGTVVTVVGQVRGC